MQAADEDNPRLSPAIRILALIVFLFLLSGTMLLIAPSIAKPLWSWDIPPFNARFLGAIYIAEVATVAILLAHNRWLPGRLSLIIALLFTIPATAGTLLHIDQLFWPGKRSGLWFALYAAYVVLPALALWFYRGLPKVPSFDLPGSLRTASLVIGIVLVGYGLVCFGAPVFAASFWPWPVDALHGRIYSGIFIAGGAGLAIVGRGAAREEIWVIGTATLVLGVFSIAGLYLASGRTGRAIVYSAGTVVWLAAFICFAVFGAALLRASLRR